MSHGANDAQKTMGIITLGLAAEGLLSRFVVPLWVIAVSAGMIALGTAAGGWRLIKTLGGRTYLKKPSQQEFQEARQIEKDADEVHRILVHELADTFVTPLDREDIFALPRAVDTFIDYIWDTVDEMAILKVPPLPASIAIAEILAEMAAEMDLIPVCSGRLP